MNTGLIRDGVFARALFVSLLIHLSAVTVFRIVIYFPRHDIEFYDVAIVQTRVPLEPLAMNPSATAAEADVPYQKLDLSGPDFGPGDGGSILPAIQLPTLRFEELNLLRMRQQALETRSRYNELFAQFPDDAWARFGRRLGTVGETLSRMTFGEPEDTKHAAPLPVSRPAPGFAAYVEWMSEPYDRQVLAVKPVDALWGVGPSGLSDAITLVFQVDRDGHVVKVINPLGDSQGVVDAAAKALSGYRFEPLLGEGPSTQAGTFIVRASGESP